MCESEVFLKRCRSTAAEDIIIREQIARLAMIALNEPNLDITSLQKEMLICAVMPSVLEDLTAYHERDPSVRLKSISYLVSLHSTFFAILCYRLAHRWIQVATDANKATELAMHLCFYPRSQTGTEIHPEASIGRRFVIDHGWGTVIGQTVEIGDDCYILNNVTLGGRHVANAPDGKRHPTIGNRVQICARAKVFGPVTLGDDCFIGPDVTITKNIPPSTRVLASPIYSQTSSVNDLINKCEYTR